MLKCIDQLQKWGACPKALRWLRKKRYPTLQQAWKNCPHYVWMRWLVTTVAERSNRNQRRKLDKLARLACEEIDKVWEECIVEPNDARANALERAAYLKIFPRAPGITRLPN